MFHMTGVFSKLSLFFSQCNWILKPYSNSKIKASLFKLEYSSSSHLICGLRQQSSARSLQHSVCNQLLWLQIQACHSTFGKLVSFFFAHNHMKNFSIPHPRAKLISSYKYLNENFSEIKQSLDGFCLARDK